MAHLDGLGSIAGEAAGRAYAVLYGAISPVREREYPQIARAYRASLKLGRYLEQILQIRSC
jgi:hypothetical protein